MAEGGGEDRTEAATPRRLDKAREEGQVAVSREVSGLAALAAFALVLMMWAPGAAHELGRRLAVFLAEAHQLDLTDGGATALRAAAMAVLHGAAPFLLAAILLALATSLLQTGFALNVQALIPNFARLSPRVGLSRIFGVTSLIDTVRSSAKLAVMGLACWHILVADVPLLLSASRLRPAALLDRTAREVAHVLLTVLAAQAAIAALDVMWVRFRHARSLRMSREELRQEVKESDGDPHVKAKIKNLRRQRSRKRMMAAVKDATVVVTNPTHYAVALAYERDKNAAPKVVAKGMDELAARIREEAERNRVPLVPNPPLARALYGVPLDADIPPEHYKAVAELIAYVWRLQGKLRPSRAA